MKHAMETHLIHGGEPSPRVDGAVVMPIFQSSTYEYAGETSYDDVRYIRLNNNPNHKVLHEKLRGLENAAAALVTASGMAAISATFLTLLKSGDHMLTQGGLYGGTHTFITEDLPDFGIAHDFIDATRPDTWKALLRPTTRMVYVESITNPLCRVGDLTAVIHFARTHGLLAVIDNTVASPVNFSAIDHGFDVSLHSATKYLNGHTDIVAGAILGRADLLQRIVHRLNHLGACLDPHACFLLHRGLRTLTLRVERQNQNALALAQFLASQPGVESVHYPGLAVHPDHERATALFKGCGGLLSFEVRGGAEEAQRFIDATQIPCKAPSLGGVETLLTRPVTTSHAGMAPADRQKLGITDRLIRMSVGIEHVQDLMGDLSQALKLQAG